MNENGDNFGKYCGYRNGQVVVVNGSLVVLRFRLGHYGRFRLLFTPANRKYNNKIYLKSLQCKLKNLFPATEILTSLSLLKRATAIVS